jgi:hypothetical protein
MSEVAILGSGPSGLMAALAAHELGFSPVIYSHKVPSKIYAAMFLHRSLPWVTNNIPDFNVDVIKMGTAEGYAQRVYGDPTHPVSWDKFADGQTPAWDLRKAYDTLYNLFENDIVEYSIDATTVNGIVNEHEFVFSSIPATALCYRRGQHLFSYQQIWVHLLDSLDLPIGSNMMYYNGDPPKVGYDWYRYSQISGHRAWEFSKEPEPNDDYELVRGKKPLGTTCTCFPGIHRIGRFGKWEKQVLTHHCYEEVRDALLNVREKRNAGSRNRHRRHAS